MRRIAPVSLLEQPAERRDVDQREQQRPVEDVVARELLALDDREEHHHERRLEQRRDHAREAGAHRAVGVEVRAREQQQRDEDRQRRDVLGLVEGELEVGLAAQRAPSARARSRSPGRRRRRRARRASSTRAIERSVRSWMIARSRNGLRARTSRGGSVDSRSGLELLELLDKSPVGHLCCDCACLPLLGESNSAARTNVSLATSSNLREKRRHRGERAVRT